MDVSAPLGRQQATFSLIKRLVGRYRFDDKGQACGCFTQLTGLLKNLNYSPRESENYDRFLGNIEELQKGTPVTTMRGKSRIDGDSAANRRHDASAHHEHPQVI